MPPREVSPDQPLRRDEPGPADSAFARPFRMLWFENLRQDLAFGFRQLRKNPGFTAVAVLTLALGIGACTAVFSVVYTAVLHPFSYENPEELVAVHETLLPGNPQAGVSPAAFAEFRRQSTVFAGVAACYFRPRNFVGADEPVRAYTQFVTHNYFSLLGVRPMLGRDFRPEDDRPGAPIVVILSHRLWQNHFGSRREAIGQPLVLEDQPATVIGVMPPDFQAEETGPAMYTPLAIPVEMRQNFAARVLTVTGRLKPGVTPARAATELDVVAARLAGQYPATNKDWGVAVNSLVEETVAFARPMLFTLLGAVAFLLLIACVNIANLQLARATSRQKEIALRTALGASRGRIVRQLLCESLLLSVLGGVLGVLLAQASMRLMLSVSPLDLPRVSEISVDGYALAFSSALVLLTGLGFGLVPALQAARLDLNQVLKDGGRGAGEGRHGLRLRRLLVIAEVALALVLLVGAGLLSKSFIGMLNVDRGYEPRNLYGAPIALMQKRYYAPGAAVTYVDQVLAKVSQVHGVAAASFATGRLTISGGTSFAIAGQPPLPLANQPRAIYASVTKDYLATIGIPLLRGRGFTDQDKPGSPPVILVNQELVRLNFPNTDPIGQRLSVMLNNNGPEVWREIVGVVANIRATDAYDPVRAQIFLPFGHDPRTWLALGVRIVPGTRLDLRAIAEAVHAVDKDVPFSMMWETTQSANRGVPAVRRFSMALSMAFSAIALLLAAIGIYGVMAYNVAQRTGEIGIRMALGAQDRDVMRMILVSGGWLVGIGVALGLAGALATARLLGSQLYNLSPYDPYVFSLIPAVLFLVAFFACWLPARRATKVDPLVALRAD